MGRLIDADKLLEETRRDRDYAEKNGFMDMYHERQALIDRIEAQQTAYDLDKVVKEINEWTFNANIDVGDGTVMNHNLIVRDTAIEIVKGGGVDAN